jgi:cyclopropane-fatty-acyl-phospholipid synthase
MMRHDPLENQFDGVRRVRPARTGLTATAASALVARLLSRLVRRGTLDWVEADGRVRRFGPGGAPEVAVRLTDRRLPLRLLLQPSLALGEAYMDGRLVLQRGTLREFLDLLTSAGPQERDTLPGSGLRSLADRLRARRLHRNPARRAKANVAHHYDLSDALYGLFLDRERQYSCAYFAQDGMTLDEAQAAKMRHIAAKLVLDRPGLSVLDIGSGWGGLARSLARGKGAKVTGITLSQEQLAHATARTKAEGLSDAVSFHLRDYRDERGRYDRIVSVGMFEHVGPRDYDTYFAAVARLLNQDGVALVHSIGIMGPDGGSDPWIRKYIFPGGYCPTLSQAIAAAERAGLWVTDVEVLRLHYAETLRHWQERFAARRDEARALYDERFCRMWEFYLAACEAGFRNGRTMVFQMQLSHRRDAAPLTRDYIGAAEAPSSAPRYPEEESPSP